MSVDVAKGERPLAVGDLVWARYYGAWWGQSVVGFVGRRVLVTSGAGFSAKALRRRNIARRHP